MEKRVISEKTREVIQAVYLGAKAKKGYKGFWQQAYQFADMIDMKGNLITQSFKLNCCACIKSQGFRRGDIIQMTLTIEPNRRGGVKPSRPASAIKVGHNSDYDI